MRLLGTADAASLVHVEDLLMLEVSKAGSVLAKRAAGAHHSRTKLPKDRLMQATALSRRRSGRYHDGRAAMRTSRLSCT